MGEFVAKVRSGQKARREHRTRPAVVLVERPSILDAV